MIKNHYWRVKTWSQRFFKFWWNGQNDFAAKKTFDASGLASPKFRRPMFFADRRIAAQTTVEKMIVENCFKISSIHLRQISSKASNFYVGTNLLQKRFKLTQGPVEHLDACPGPCESKNWQHPRSRNKSSRKQQQQLLDLMKQLKSKALNNCCKSRWLPILDFETIWA